MAITVCEWHIRRGFRDCTHALRARGKLSSTTLEFCALLFVAPLAASACGRAHDGSAAAAMPRGSSARDRLRRRTRKPPRSAWSTAITTRITAAWSTCTTTCTTRSCSIPEDITASTSPIPRGEDLPASVASSVTLMVERPKAAPETLNGTIDAQGESWTVDGQPVARQDTSVRVSFVARGAAVLDRRPVHPAG